ncbi:hypothetical protein HZS_5817 [Henneguya salminicola]|nr:hypothetical protein HZS_5817 [Henneguya salminicola]
MFQYPSVDEVFNDIISILQTNLQDFRQNKKLYHSNLLLLASVNETYKILCSNPVLNFIITPNKIIASIFEDLSSIKVCDEFDVCCIDCLSHINFSKEFTLNGIVYARSFALNSIQTAIKQNLYTRVECFQHDFLSLCKVARYYFSKFSEPYIHSYKLYKEFMKLRHKYITPESYICKFTHYWSLDFRRDSSHDNSSLKKEQESVANCFSLQHITNSAIDTSFNKTGEVISNYIPTRRLCCTLGVLNTISYCRENNVSKIFLIRKLFCLKSGKKAFIGNLMIDPKDVNLCYNRKFAKNELIVSNLLECHKVKTIIKKVNVHHTFIHKNYHTSHIVENFYFFHTVINFEQKTLCYINFQPTFIDSSYKLREAPLEIERSEITVSKCRLIQPIDFISNMFIHMFFNSFLASGTDGLGEIVQIVNKNRHLRKGDFIKIKGSNNHLIYQINEFLQTNLKLDDQLKDSYTLSCREYLPINSIDICSTILYYEKEIVQTNTVSSISLDQIESVVCVLTESQYIKHVFPDEIIFFDNPPPKFVKYFGKAIEREISQIWGDGSKKILNETKIEYNSISSLSSDNGNAHLVDSQTITNARCFWEDCNFSTSKFITLFEHFCSSHEIDPKLFVCRWRGCLKEENDNE